MILTRGLLQHLERIDELLNCGGSPNGTPNGLCMDVFYYLDFFDRRDFKEAVFSAYDWEIIEYVQRIDVLVPHDELTAEQLVQMELRTSKFTRETERKVE